ncbi:MAG: hypothetical protein JO270_08295 [Acidobacteriaceae bacterium]|nr:hypothetical protein [Acidobacteriaceae bacterium]
MARNLTLGQATLITTIRNFQHIHGYTPSITELAQTLDRARGTIHTRLKSLQRRGILVRHGSRARALEIMPQKTGSQCKFVQSSSAA